jgi:hypothetical protein
MDPEGLFAYVDHFARGWTQLIVSAPRRGSENKYPVCPDADKSRNSRVGGWSLNLVTGCT